MIIALIKYFKYYISHPSSARINSLLRWGDVARKYIVPAHGSARAWLSLQDDLKVRCDPWYNIFDFRPPPRRADICAFPEYYPASCGNCLPTFRDNASVTSSRVNSQTPDPWRWERRSHGVTHSGSPKKQARTWVGSWPIVFVSKNPKKYEKMRDMKVAAIISKH
jgi:hypothetical protein